MPGLRKRAVGQCAAFELRTIMRASSVANFAIERTVLIPVKAIASDKSFPVCRKFPAIPCSRQKFPAFFKKIPMGREFGRTALKFLVNLAQGPKQRFFAGFPVNFPAAREFEATSVLERR